MKSMKKTSSSNRSFESLWELDELLKNQLELVISWLLCGKNTISNSENNNAHLARHSRRIGLVIGYFNGSTLEIR